jgi:hypothetical protein
MLAGGDGRDSIGEPDGLDKIDESTETDETAGSAAKRIKLVVSDSNSIKSNCVKASLLMTLT